MPQMIPCAALAFVALVLAGGTVVAVRGRGSARGEWLAGVMIVSGLAAAGAMVAPLLAQTG